MKESDFLDVRNFWKIVKPLFSSKRSNYQITFIKNNTIITTDKEESEIFLDFFSNIVSNLNIQFEDKCALYKGNLKDPVEISILVYKEHLSVLKIYENIEIQEIFLFSEIIVECMFNEI